MLNDGASVASIKEEWMFRHSYYGDTTNVKAPEIVLKPSQIDNNVEVINFSDADIEFVNGTIIVFNTESMGQFNNREQWHWNRQSCRIDCAWLPLRVSCLVSAELRIGGSATVFELES